MNWTKCMLWVGVIVTFAAGESLAGTPLILNQQTHDSEPLDVANYKTVDPALAEGATSPTWCPHSGIVAFSAIGTHHVSEGGNTLLGYSTTITNQGNGWTPGGGTFIAPCTGLYVFTASFVKDANYYGGTTNDVYIHIHRNGVSQGVAWSGQATGTRGTGTYTVALILNAGDYVQSYADSDGGQKRHLIRYNFTGYLVKPY